MTFNDFPVWQRRCVGVHWREYATLEYLLPPWE